jgi:hypothetical protein
MTTETSADQADVLDAAMNRLQIALERIAARERPLAAAAPVTDHRDPTAIVQKLDALISRVGSALADSTPQNAGRE